MSAASNLAANYSHRRLRLSQKSNMSAVVNSKACPQHVSMSAASTLSRTYLRLSQSPPHYCSHPPPHLTSIRPSYSHGALPRADPPHLRLRARQEVERLALRWRLRVSICTLVLEKPVN